MSHKVSHAYSIAHSEEFWLKQSKELSWKRFPGTASSLNAKGFYQWFEDGELNMAHLCLDHHIENGRGENVALICDSPVTGTVQQFTFTQLKTDVAKFAGALISKGIKKGDTVIIYMPMIPQAIIAMLACARIGAVHSVVFGGFASHELALRIDDCKPKALITASYGIEVDKLIAYTPLVKKQWKRQHSKRHLQSFISVNKRTRQMFLSILRIFKPCWIVLKKQPVCR